MQDKYILLGTVYLFLHLFLFVMFFSFSYFKSNIFFFNVAMLLINCKEILCFIYTHIGNLRLGCVDVVAHIKLNYFNILYKYTEIRKHQKVHIGRIA